MKLYLLRHGRTLWNEEGRLQGRTDVPLSDEGRCSALAAGAALESVPFDAAFSSPLQRARETAELILRGKNIAVQTDVRLMELDSARQRACGCAILRKRSSPQGRCFLTRNIMCRQRGARLMKRWCAAARAFLDERIVSGGEHWTHVLVVAHGAAVPGFFQRHVWSGERPHLRQPCAEKLCSECYRLHGGLIFG